MRWILFAAGAIAGVLTSDALVRAETVTVSDCLVQMNEWASIAAQEQGMLEEVLVRDGQSVKAEQLLARIDTKLAELQLKVSLKELEAAEKRAKDTASVEYAEAGNATKQKEYERKVNANKNHLHTISQTDVDLALLEWTQFYKQIIKSRYELEIAAMDAEVKRASLEAAREHINRCEVKAPWDGVVQKVERYTGSWVQPGDSILKLVRMDKLRVSFKLNISKHLPQQVADVPVAITVVLRGESVHFAGRVTGVSPQVQTGGDYDVWAEVENISRNEFWLLRPGMRATIALEPR